MFRRQVLPQSSGSKRNVSKKQARASARGKPGSDTGLDMNPDRISKGMLLRLYSTLKMETVGSSETSVNFD
jgi:hypothetical protein